MFGFLFGWRKASRCKKLIKGLRCRVKLLRNKRYSIVRQLRDDVAQLIRIGYEERAFNRAEQLFRDENAMAVYDLLDNFCEFILMHFSYIRKHKDLPNDIHEAISSLIFTSARCGDLPELRELRTLFGERYGQRCASMALELLSGNSVNHEIIEKLSVDSVPDDAKHRLIDEITRDYCLKKEILALEYTPEFHNQVERGIMVEQDPQTRDEEDTRDQDVFNEMEMKTVDPEIISYSVSSSIFQRSSSDMLESPKNEKAETPVATISRVDSFCDFAIGYSGTRERHETGGTCMIAPTRSKQGLADPASSMESFPQFSEETLAYLDEIEELEPYVTVDGDGQDRRLFRFRSPVKPNKEKPRDAKYHEDVDPYESMSEGFSSRTSRSCKKRPRRRVSASWENFAFLNDTSCVIYYGKPRKRSQAYRPSYHRQTKNQKRTHRQRSQHGSSKPCYIMSYDVFRYPGKYSLKPTKQSKGREERAQGYFFPRSQSSASRSISDDGHHGEINEDDSRRKVSSTPPYLRAMTMPQERAKEGGRERLVRSHSCSSQNPNHVHPKLPEYDDIAAKFMALKEQCLQKNERW